MSKYVTGLCHLIVKHCNLRDIHGYPGHPIDAVHCYCEVTDCCIIADNIKYSISILSRNGLRFNFKSIWLPILFSLLELTSEFSLDELTSKFSCDELTRHYRLQLKRARKIICTPDYSCWELKHDSTESQQMALKNTRK